HRRHRRPRQHIKDVIGSGRGSGAKKGKVRMCWLRKLCHHIQYRSWKTGSYWSGCRATQVGSSGMPEPVGSTWMVASSVEQKLRLPLQGMGIPTARYPPVGAEPTPVTVKLYPFLLPAA